MGNNLNMFLIISVCYPYVIVVLSIILLYKRQKKKLFRPPYPPGPKGLPLIGNICDVPKSHEWVIYSQWSHQYKSSVVYLNLAGTHLVIVNSAEAAHELFDKRSVIYSDRPRMSMLTELMNWDVFSIYRYGRKWRTARRIFHQFFNSNTSVMYQPKQTKCTHEFLYRLVHDPENYRDHVRLMTGSFILNITYGIDAQSVDDPYMLMAEESVEAARITANPGSFLVDTIPLLKYLPAWFPGAGFQNKAKEWRKITAAAAEVPFQHVKDEMAKGLHTPSMASLALERFKGEKEAEEVISGTCSVAYVGGSDTIMSTLYTFFLAMVLHPQVVRKAHEELDAVVGKNRLPAFPDKRSLPYICAIIKEALRWHPAAPLAIVHRLMVDDVYDEMFLPCGSLVLGNAWAILHDESVYKDPGKFDPDRFLKDGELDPDIRPPEVAAFGFGRRICPGRHLALESIFLNIACILAIFDIGKAIGDDGEPITPSEEFTTGLICRPVPFKCSIKPRSQQASSLVADAYAVYHPRP